MKILKKMAVLMLTVCLIAPCFTLIANAASGTFQFTDPTTKVGETVTVEASIRTGGEAIGDGNATVTYDPAALEFAGGDNATGENGTVKLDSTGNGTVTELKYSMQFKVLKEGETELSVAEYTAYLFSDEKLNLTLGTSKITAAAGELTDQAPLDVGGAGGSVDVNGTTYTVAQDFSEALIPIGFTKTTMPYEGAEYQVLVQDTSGMYLIYLQAQDGTKEFYLYDKENGMFSLFTEISISQDSYIALLQDGNKVQLPNNYEKTTISLEEGGQQYPAWQDTKKQEFYIVYALSSSGQKGLYQYDTIDKTYQRFTAPEVTKEKKSTGIFAKALDYVEQNMDKVLIVVWVVFVLMLLLLIVTLVKLRHRNLELDDLYDEYDIGDNGDSKGQMTQGKKGQFKKSRIEDADDFDNADDEEEEDFDDLEDDFEESDDDSEEEPRARKGKAVSHTEDDSDFAFDFIDLDD